MEIALKIMGNILGIIGIITWVTLLGLGFAALAPDKIRKKKLELTDCIAIVGIGMFCTFLTLIFLWLVPKMGMSQLHLTSIFGQALSHGEENLLAKWGGRFIAVTLGAFASITYATLFFNRIPWKTFGNGLLFGSILFLIGAVVVFPFMGIFPGVQMEDMMMPSFFGSLAGGPGALMTFFAGMFIFGSLMAGIYNGWDEV